MRWEFAHGLLVGARSSLAPSTSALGPNIYLSRRDFFKMLGLAFLVHALAFGIAAIIPRDTVTDIPVRALAFKLGDSNKIAAYNSAPTPAVRAAAPAPKPVAKPIPAPVMEAASADNWRATPPARIPVVPAPLKPIAKHQPKPQPKERPEPQPKVVKVEDPAPAPPAIAPTPQQYVREVGGAPDGAIGGQGNETTMTEQTMQAIRSRYEQEISSWIQRHKFYPADASGREGRAIVRVRIDRAGNVRYYAIEQSAGLTTLDNAALEMIRRANPVPAVPTNYPAGNLVEFLIPISFKAPQ